jgi:hypothetical protein
MADNGEASSLKRTRHDEEVEHHASESSSLEPEINGDAVSTAAASSECASPQPFVRLSKAEKVPTFLVLASIEASCFCHCSAQAQIREGKITAGGVAQEVEDPAEAIRQGESSGEDT